MQTFETSNGVYTGETLDNKMHGLGLLVYDSGDVYFGDFESHEKHGEGI